MLIADTYRQFNLRFASFEEKGKLPGPFRYTGSLEQSHRDAIARVFRAEMVFIAEDGDEIIGVLRG